MKLVMKSFAITSVGGLSSDSKELTVNVGRVGIRLEKGRIRGLISEGSCYVSVPKNGLITITASESIQAELSVQVDSMANPSSKTDNE